jgi:hypothetical protein
MSFQTLYRGMSAYLALTVALVSSAVVALTLAALGATMLGFTLGKLHSPGDLGDGILVILTALNIAFPTFVGAFSAMVRWHHRTSPLTPTFAFALGVVLIRSLGSFSLTFAPLMLGTGTIVWIICCWLLRKKEVPEAPYRHT